MKRNKIVNLSTALKSLNETKVYENDLDELMGILNEGDSELDECGDETTNEEDIPDIDILKEMDLNEDILFEDDAQITSEKKMSEEELKIESLKIATNIAKLMKDVSPDDIIQISSSVASFIRNHEIGEEDLNFDETK